MLFKNENTEDSMLALVILMLTTLLGVDDYRQRKNL